MAKHSMLFLYCISPRVIFQEHKKQTLVLGLRLVNFTLSDMTKAILEVSGKAKNCTVLPVPVSTSSLPVQCFSNHRQYWNMKCHLSSSFMVHWGPLELQPHQCSDEDQHRATTLPPHPPIHPRHSWGKATEWWPSPFQYFTQKREVGASSWLASSPAHP